MLGLKTACLYGWQPLQFGYCIPRNHRSASRKMLRYLAGEKVKAKEIREILRQYVAAYPMYLLIAQKNKIKDPFTDKVVRAYWLGNGLLARAGGFKAHHSHHVYYVGSASGAITFNDQLRDLCRIAWGQVEKKSQVLTVVYQPVKKKNHSYYLAKPIKKRIAWNRAILPQVEIGDWVSIHWQQAVAVLSYKDRKNLEKYTQQTLTSL